MKAATEAKATDEKSTPDALPNYLDKDGKGNIAVPSNDDSDSYAMPEAAAHLDEEVEKLTTYSDIDFEAADTSVNQGYALLSRARFTYIDADKEAISISSNKELEDAFGHFYMHSLRFRITMTIPKK